MAPVDLPYLQVYRSNGKQFVYFRRSGRQVRINAAPGTPAFLAEYQAALARTAPAPPIARPKPPDGSLRDLAARYRASADYLGIAAKTRRDYDRMLAPLLAMAGDWPVRDLPRDWIKRRQAELIDKPRTANYLIAVLRRVLAYGIDIGMLASNPAAGIKPLRTGPGHRVWTEAEIAAMTSAAAGDVALPVLLGLFTAQREADILRMTWGAYEGGRISLTQGKTRAQVIIPVHVDLAAALAATRREALVICVTGKGLPWKADWFRHRFAQVRAEMGLPDDCTFHGLRHSCASWLAEQGASDGEIQAITGHKDRKMVAHYTHGARQAKLATAGIARLPRKGS